MKRAVVFATTVSMVVLFFGQQSARSATLFHADLTTDQVVPNSLATGKDASGVATLLYDPAGPTLTYDIQFFGADANLVDVPSAGGDIVAIHIHDAPAGSNGPHRLNMLGQPGINLGDNDGDVVVNVTTNSLTGKWDDGDVGHDPPYTGPETEPLSDHIGALFAETLYFQVHSVDVPSPDGILRGQIRLVPEPSAIAGCIVGLLALFTRCRQSRGRR